MEEDEKKDQVVNDQPEAVNAEVAEQQETEQEKNFRALRESKDRYKREAEEKDRIIAELRAQQEQKATKNSFISGDPDDWTTNAQFEEGFRKYDQDVMTRVEKLLASYKYPNAHELLTKYGNEIPPKVANALTKSGDLEAAMEAVKMTPSYIRDHSKEHVNVAKAKANEAKPKSTLAAGGSGAISKASRYKSMTREERLQLQNKFMMGG